MFLSNSWSRNKFDVHSVGVLDKISNCANASLNVVLGSSRKQRGSDVLKRDSDV